MKEVMKNDRNQKSKRTYGNGKRIENEVKEIVVNIVETILVPKAKEGESTVYINCGEHKDAVISMLRENGYICERYNSELRVRW